MKNNQQCQPSLPRDDGWLLPFLPVLGEHGKRLLELGCGPGLDAATLLAAGFEVVAFDRTPLETARDHARGARLFRADLRNPLPVRSASVDAALASLSLHYLPWKPTLDVFREVRRVLHAGSPFLFRVNATDDVNHGAGEGAAVEPDYCVARPGSWASAKRFFDETAVRTFLAGAFEVERLEHRTIYRYELPKRVWECLARAI